MIEISNAEAILAIASVVFCAGGFYYGIKAELKALRHDISRIENKCDVYNHTKERLDELEARFKMWLEMQKTNQ